MDVYRNCIQDLKKMKSMESTIVDIEESSSPSLLRRDTISFMKMSYSICHPNLMRKNTSAGELMIDELCPTFSSPEKRKESNTSKVFAPIHLDK